MKRQKTEAKHYCGKHEPTAGPSKAERHLSKTQGENNTARRRETDACGCGRGRTLTRGQDTGQRLDMMRRIGGKDTDGYVACGGQVGGGGRAMMVIIMVRLRGVGGAGRDTGDGCWW